MVQKVFLWCTPRSLSTVLQHSISLIEKSKVFHEPFDDVFYLGPERQSERYFDKPTNHDLSYEKVAKNIAETNDVEYIMVKQIARTLLSHKELLVGKEFKDFQHVFLLRDPRKSAVSYYKCSIDKTMGWDLTIEELGCKELYELFCFVRENLEEKPLVLNAAELQVAPKDFMETFCSSIGFPYSDNLLTWKPSSINQEAFWDGWNKAVLSSTGFRISDRAAVNTFEDLSKYPDVVGKIVEQDTPYYNLLNEYCTTCLKA